MLPTVALLSDDPARNPRSFLFADPVDQVVARSAGQVFAALKEVERKVASGLHAAGFVCYEAAAALDPAMRVLPPSALPLVWFGLFRRRLEIDPDGFGQDEDFSFSEWCFSIDQAVFAQAIDRIRQYIAAGDTYQVNFTLRCRAAFRGSTVGLFHALRRSQRAPYSAYIDLGRFKIVSVSPELFFHLSGRQLRARPMKGTMCRGRWSEEDETMASDLARCPKNRAENVMIVDLMRNDLGRVAEVGSVGVPRLFEVERYDTLFQMTSTVQCRLRAEAGLADLLAAAFPSGSVTGAPKIRTMQIIAELEDSPRGIYTGSIGFLSPDGEAVFNVAIRTVLLDSDSGRAELGVGAGITFDSDADSEYAECELKTRFVTAPPPSDFELLETLLYERDQGYFLLDRHLQRMEASARYFGFAFDRAQIARALIEKAAALNGCCHKLRLLLSRAGRLSITASPLSEADRSDPPPVSVAAQPVNSEDRFLFHKTTRRDVYESRARTRPDRADVILVNERGEVTESTIANVVAKIDGQLWTPPVTSGLLPGTFRDDLLARGVVRERVLYPRDLERAETVYLVNSVRKWVPVTLVP